MENGPHGLSGLRAVPPVAQELVLEPESVTTHHRNMAGGTALAKAMKLAAVMNRNVLVSLLARNVLQYIQQC